MPRAVTTTSPNSCESRSILIVRLFSPACTTISFAAKPTDDTVRVVLPEGTLMVNDPSGEVETALVVPFTTMVTPANPALSLEETTFPEILRFCANKNVPHSRNEIQSRPFAFAINSVLEVTDCKTSLGKIRNELSGSPMQIRQN